MQDCPSLMFNCNILSLCWNSHAFALAVRKSCEDLLKYSMLAVKNANLIISFRHVLLYPFPTFCAIHPSQLQYYHGSTRDHCKNKLELFHLEKSITITQKSLMITFPPIVESWLSNIIRSFIDYDFKSINCSPNIAKILYFSGVPCYGIAILSFQ